MKWVKLILETENDAGPEEVSRGLRYNGILAQVESYAVRVLRGQKEDATQLLREKGISYRLNQV